MALALFFACDNADQDSLDPAAVAGASQGGGGTSGGSSGKSSAGATTTANEGGQGGAGVAAGNGGTEADDGGAGSGTGVGPGAAGAMGIGGGAGAPGAAGAGDVAGAAGAIGAAGGAGEVSVGGAAGATGTSGDAGAGGADDSCAAVDRPPPTLCDGTLEFAIDHVPAGNDPYAIVSGYLDCDANLDLVVTNVNDNYGSISVLLGNGDGTFEPAVNYSVGGYSPHSMAIGRFDADDDLDLVVMSYGGMGAILSSVPGNGDGTFGLATPYGTYDGLLYPTSGLEAADFDEDGHLDLASTNLNSSDRGYVTVLFGDSSGAFAPPDVWYGYNYDGTGFVIADDFDADSHLDLVFTNPSSVSLYVNEAGELGTFSSLGSVSFQGVTPRGLSAGDFDGDGDVDLVTVTSNGTNVGNKAAVSLNDGDGTFADVVNYASGVNPTSVLSADFSGDGELDLAVAHMKSTLDGTELGLLLGLGDGTFQDVTQYPASDMKPMQVSGPRRLTSGDFDNDGNLDIAMVNVDGDDVTIFRRSGCEL